MAKVKPDEISAILKEQISGFDTQSKLRRTRNRIEVGDGIARVFGLTNVMSGELVEFETELRLSHLNLEEDNVGLGTYGCFRKNQGR